MTKKQSEDILILRDYVKQLMKAKQITYKELADALNLNYRTVSGNLNRSISYKTIMKIINYLDGDLCYALSLPIKKETKNGN
jgi:DNA-binding helix-turn-helix protein